jgi:hypothetical protein
MIWIDPRTAAAVGLTFAFMAAGLGRALPLDGSEIVPLVVSAAFLTGYFYLWRTLLRLPFALVITLRRARHAQTRYGLSRRESLRDGYVRGFLDTRRWTVGPLALFDRMAVFCLALLACTPGAAQLFLWLGGIIGLALLLTVYLLRGTFGWLVDEAPRPDGINRPALPFLDLRD